MTSVYKNWSALSYQKTARLIKPFDDESGRSKPDKGDSLSNCTTNRCLLFVSSFGGISSV